MEPRRVDIWMGTLSKMLVFCGGLYRKQQSSDRNFEVPAPGFGYSVGHPPPTAALNVLKVEPERVERLRTNSALFLSQSRVRAENYQRLCACPAWREQRPILKAKF